MAGLEYIPEGQLVRLGKWDTRFIKLAEHVAEWSKDPSTKVGAVIVSPDRTQVVFGYNGFPRGVDDSPNLYEDKQVKYERVVHAELNAILNCPQKPLGWTIYIIPLPPCNECAKAIIQSGIKKVVFVNTKPAKDKWREAWEISKEMFQEAGVEVICA